MAAHARSALIARRPPHRRRSHRTTVRLDLPAAVPRTHDDDPSAESGAIVHEPDDAQSLGGTLGDGTIAYPAWGDDGEVLAIEPLP